MKDYLLRKGKKENSLQEKPKGRRDLHICGVKELQLCEGGEEEKGVGEGVGVLTTLPMS